MRNERDFPHKMFRPAKIKPQLLVTGQMPFKSHQLSSVLQIAVLLVSSFHIEVAIAVLAGSTKNYDWNSKINELQTWKTAGIGEICEKEEVLLELIAKRPNDTEYRKKLSAKHCSEKLACNFEIPDLKQVTFVCDCESPKETWDDKAKECRRFAGRKQSCTDDVQCITGAECKNEEVKLRDYARWEAALYRHFNITTPRSVSKAAYGKVQKTDINDARRRRKRILSRIVRHSYKEEVGECTCIRKELKLEYINKTDPCPARKYPPPLKLIAAWQSPASGYLLIFAVLPFLLLRKPFLC